MYETIITALLPIIVTLMLGYLAGWEREFSQDQAAVLNRMVMNFALPLLLFAGILGTPLSSITKDADLLIWTTVGMAGGVIVIYLISRFIFRSPTQISALRALAIAGPAVPFVGTPVLGVLYPGDADIAIAIGSLLMNLIQVPLVLFLLTHGSASNDAHESALASVGKSIVNAFRKPVVWAPILAFILLLFGFDMPKMLKGSFLLLGQATGGVALFAVGAVLYSQKVSVSLPVVVNVLAKNIALPAIILLAMIALAVPGAERGITTVTLAIPTASIAVIFAVDYKCGEKEMASTLFFSTILSIITMGGFIWITG